MAEIFGREHVHFVVDCYGQAQAEIQDKLSKLDGFNVLALTDDFVVKEGLHFDIDNTGWVCGDYCLYRGLDLQWSHAWIVEPDVYLIGGADKILESLSLRRESLIATDYEAADQSWYWSKYSQDVLPGYPVYKILFPLVRVSREVALKGLELRRNITRNLLKESPSRVPNDEAIIGTAAFLTGAKCFDLRRELSQHFKYWSTTTRTPVADIVHQGIGPQFVHSGMTNEEFRARLSDLWLSHLAGHELNGLRVLKSLLTASEKTKQRTIELLISKTEEYIVSQK